MAPQSPVEISHKKDGRQRWPHRFHVSCPPPYPAAGSDAGTHPTGMHSCFRSLFVLMVHTEIIKPHYVVNFEVKYVAIPAIVLLTVYTALHQQPVSDSILSRHCVLRPKNLMTCPHGRI